jgi:hypothetical protein
VLLAVPIVATRKARLRPRWGRENQSEPANQTTQETQNPSGQKSGQRRTTKLRTALIITLASVLGAGIASAQQQGSSPKPASKATKAANLAMQQYLNFNGFIGKPDTLTIKNAQGQPVWDLDSYKAYISLDKPAVRDANDTMMKKQSQCKIWQAGNERRILKRSYLCEHV